MLFLFRIRLNKLFHITDVYIYTPQDKIITEFIKKLPLSKMYIPLNLNTVCHFLDDPRLFLYFVMSVHESLVISWAVQQRNPPAPAPSLVFQHLLHIWSLSKSDCMVLRSIFLNRGQLRDSYKTITKSENIYWCSRRQHSALRARGCKLLNRMMMMCKFFSFLFNYHIFSFSTGLQKTK